MKRNWFDVIVIGGGVAGCSLGLELSKCDETLSIAIFEKESIGAGASSMSAGTIYGKGIGNSSDLAAFACHKTLQICSDLEDDFEFVQCGALQVLLNPEQLAWGRKVVKKSRINGYNVHLLTKRKELRVVEPMISPMVYGAIYTPLSAHVDPAKFCHALVKAAQRRGVVVKEDGVEGAVVDIQQLEDRVYRVTTADGRCYDTRRVVIAAGIHCNELGKHLGVSIPVEAVKGMIWVTEPLPKDSMKNITFMGESEMWFTKNSSRDDENNVPELCTHTGDGRVLTRHAYGRQRKDGRIIFGGDRLPVYAKNSSNSFDAVAPFSKRRRPAIMSVENDDESEMIKNPYEIVPSVVAGNFDFVNSDVMCLPRDVEIEGAWAGMMPFSKDGKPLVGELDKVGLPGIYILGGFGPNGIMQGPGCASILAKKIVFKEECTIDLKEWDACRVDGGVKKI
eukprot:g1088.t1